MKYMGSKNRIAKHILPIMLDEAKKQNITTWIEPFVGGANIIDKVPDTFKRIGYDLNPHTIAALTAIRDMVDELPFNVTEEEYNNYKFTDSLHPIENLIRFGASFGGKFDGGFARGKTENGKSRNYWHETYRNAEKQSPNIQGVTLVNTSYSFVSPIKSLIYCDPPYQGTTGYKTGCFDHDAFFEWCRNMKARGNVVFVSEYNAPDDFECVWQGEVKTNFASTRTKPTHTAIEKLYKV